MMDPADQARFLLKTMPVYLDTETTGLDSRAEVVKISVIDHDGSVLIDTLVQPTISIPAEASAIHGITDEMVADAPIFAEILQKLQRVISSRCVIIYNARYDTRMLSQSAVACKVPLNTQGYDVFCAMKLYSRYYGEKSFYGDYKWQYPETAAEQQGIKFDGILNRTLADAQLTRLLMHKIAGVEL